MAKSKFIWPAGEFRKDEWNIINQEFPYHMGHKPAIAYQPDTGIAFIHRGLVRCHIGSLRDLLSLSKYLKKIHPYIKIPAWNIIPGHYIYETKRAYKDFFICLFFLREIAKLTDNDQLKYFCIDMNGKISTKDRQEFPDGSMNLPLTIGFGMGKEFKLNPTCCVVQDIAMGRNPRMNDMGVIGQGWVNMHTGQIWKLESITDTNYRWIQVNEHKRSNNTSQ